MTGKDRSQEIINSFMGRTFKVDFGEAVFHTTINSEYDLTFKPIKGNLGGDGDSLLQ
jgi:hypothetical protein